MSHLKQSCDIAVIGSGAAGIAAAVAAARTGAKTIIIDTNSSIGGTATQVNVGTICGIYQRGQATNGKMQVHGFAKDFCKKLAIHSKSSGQQTKDGLGFLPYASKAFTELCETYLKEGAIEFLAQTNVESCRHNTSEINSLALSRKGQTIELSASAFVDCTGTALLSKLCLLPTIQDTLYQSPAISMRVKGLIATSEQSLTLTIMKELRRAVDNKIFNDDCFYFSLVPGSLTNDQALFKCGAPSLAVDPENQLQNLSEYSRTILRYLKEKSSAFSNATIESSSNKLGIRTGERHCGQYCLNEDDIVSGRKFPDAVAIGLWPIEVWQNSPQPVMKHLEQDQFEIPSRALSSATLGNLYFAGRNFSASHEAIAAARVIGTCLQTGYAAGTMAASHYTQLPLAATIQSLRQTQVHGESNDC